MEGDGGLELREAEAGMLGGPSSGREEPGKVEEG